MEKNYKAIDARISIDTVGDTFPAERIIATARKCVHFYARSRGYYLSEEDQKDLIQDICAKAFRCWKSYDPSKSCLENWVKLIAFSCQTNTFKKSVRRAVTFKPLESYYECGDEYIDCEIERAAGGGYSADQEVQTYEAVDHIQVIGSLPESQRRILSLSLEEGLKPKKIAEMLGSNPQAVATNLCKARKSVAQKLGMEFLADHGFASRTFLA